MKNFTINNCFWSFFSTDILPMQMTENKQFCRLRQTLSKFQFYKWFQSPSRRNRFHYLHIYVRFLTQTNLLALARISFGIVSSFSAKCDHFFVWLKNTYCSLYYFTSVRLFWSFFFHWISAVSTLSTPKIEERPRSLSMVDKDKSTCLKHL